MNARETYNAIATGHREDQQQALFQLLGMVQELSTATLELAGRLERLNGKDALNPRSCLWLREFLELPRE
jgi:hypothetical protein